jgi:hypothetical protein
VALMPQGRPYLTPKHPPGTVVYCTSGYARCMSFYDALAQLEVPNGTGMEKSVGTGLAAMMNGLMAGLREESRWVWILGDDHNFEPDLLKRMIIRAELYQCPVLVPLVSKKSPPFDSVLFNLQTTKPLDFHDIHTDDAPMKVHAAGTAGMLVQRHVLDKIMANPDASGWARPFRIGWGAPDASDEDVYFCHRIRECGFDIHVDPTLGMDHIPAEVFVRPVRTPNGEWWCRFKWPDGRHFMIPMQRPQR